jgi:hypothetical protein
MKKLGIGGKLDKYHSYMLGEGDLKPDEIEMLGRYKRAHALMSTGFSKGQVKTILANEFELSDPQVYAIVRESIKVYGDLDEVDKKGERLLAIENFKLLAQLARKEGNINAAIRAEENVTKLQGLFDADAGGMDPHLFMIPVPMEFSSDPAVLQEQQRRGFEAEDTDFEEVDEPA